MAGFDRCAFLFERWKNLAMWRNLWTILLFIFASALVIFLVAAVLFFTTSEMTTGALATLALIVNCVGVAWIVERRNQAVAEESEAKQDLLANCGQPPALGAAPGLEIARKPGAGVADEGTSFDPASLAEVENKLKLFGLFR